MTGASVVVAAVAGGYAFTHGGGVVDEGVPGSDTAAIWFGLSVCLAVVAGFVALIGCIRLWAAPRSDPRADGGGDQAP
ncbi:hypothetical protein [Micropruina sp.]|uniref:hypothetical protein n=1 Tax=Micropruina sp. TaxID=2737536 RepID=UPI0039E3A484